MTAPLSVNVPVDSQIEISDSCNQCCCFGFRRKPKSVEKAANQASKISKQESPRKVERNVTHIHLDITQSKDDVEFIQDYKVSPGKE